MKIRVTITKEIDDEYWGFSELIGERDFKKCIPEIIELFNEDISEILENAKWELEQIKN